MRADVDRVLGVMTRATAPSTTRVRRPTRRGTASVARGWARLPLSSKRATSYATLLVIVIEVLLRVQPIDRVSRWLRAPLVDSGGDVDLPALEASHLGAPELGLLDGLAWVQRAWLVDATCLRRALASGWVLRRHKPHLCLGLAGSDEALAHAWLVLEGRSLDGLPGAPLFKRGERQGGAGERG